MDATKLTKLNEDFSIFRDMIAEIFSISSNEGTLSDTFTNPSNFIMIMSHRVVLIFNQVAKTDIYQFIVGVAIIGVCLYTIMQFCEENNIYNKIDLFSTRVIRKIIFLIVCFVLIYSLHAIFYTILSVFRYIVYFILDVTDSDASIPSLITTFDATEIAYNILDKEHVLDGTALIDETIARTKEASLRSLYFMPWAIAWVSNLGLVITVFVTSIRLLVYGTVYVVSISDIVLGIKKSRFLAYTKNLVSIAFRFAIIALILYLFRITCYPYLNKMLSDIMVSGASYFKIAMMFVAVRASEFILILTSGFMAKKMFGVK